RRNGHPIPELQLSAPLARIYHFRPVHTAHRRVVRDRNEVVSASAFRWTRVDPATIHDLGCCSHVLLHRVICAEHALGDPPDRVRGLQEMSLCDGDAVHWCLLGTLVEAAMLPDTKSGDMVH